MPSCLSCFRSCKKRTQTVTITKESPSDFYEKIVQQPLVESSDQTAVFHKLKTQSSVLTFHDDSDPDSEGEEDDTPVDRRFRWCSDEETEPISERHDIPPRVEKTIRKERPYGHPFVTIMPITEEEAMRLAEARSNFDESTVPKYPRQPPYDPTWKEPDNPVTTIHNEVIRRTIINNLLRDMGDNRPSLSLQRQSIYIGPIRRSTAKNPVEVRQPQFRDIPMVYHPYPLVTKHWPEYVENTYEQPRLSNDGVRKLNEWFRANGVNVEVLDFEGKLEVANMRLKILPISEPDMNCEIAGMMDEHVLRRLRSLRWKSKYFRVCYTVLTAVPFRTEIITLKLLDDGLPDFNAPVAAPAAAPAPIRESGTL